MTDDILHTIQNPDELRRLATELLTAQARKYEQRLHNLNTVNSTLEQRIHDLHAAMQAEKTAYEQRIRELEEALKRDLLTQPVLQILDTQKGKAKKGYLWAYVSAAGSARDIVVYDCRPGRGGEYARAMLAGWSGTLVVDGYAGYSALFRGGQEGESPVASGIREAGCLAHVRRKFMELYRMNGSPGAREALEQIRALYILERTIRFRPAEQKRRWRRRYARPRMEAFHAWLSAGEKTSAPGGALHGAITYALKRWQALTTYLDDGQVPVDNNRCE